MMVAGTPFSEADPQFRQHLDAALRQMEAKVGELFERSGPWCLACDGASSKAHRLYCVTARASGVPSAVVLSMPSGGFASQDANYIKEVLLKAALRLGTKCSGVVMDNSSACNKAAELLRTALVEKGVDTSRFATLRCAEHTGQLVLRDLTASIPWAKARSPAILARSIRGSSAIRDGQRKEEKMKVRDGKRGKKMKAHR